MNVTQTDTKKKEQPITGLTFIKKKDRNNRTVMIPVVDATASPEARDLANKMIKSSNQSKYMTRSYAIGYGCYQDSQKEIDQ